MPKETEQSLVARDAVVRACTIYSKHISFFKVILYFKRTKTCTACSTYLQNNCVNAPLNTNTHLLLSKMFNLILTLPFHFVLPLFDIHFWLSVV